MIALFSLATLHVVPIILISYKSRPRQPKLMQQSENMYALVKEKNAHNTHFDHIPSFIANDDNSTNI